MRRLLKEYAVGDPFFVRNIVLGPILAHHGDSIPFTLLENAVEKCDARILDRGRVDTVELSYRGNNPLLLIEGEEILGALQNRVISTSVYIKEHEPVYLPVVCVEEGRWSGGAEFKESETVAYPTLRSILASSVYESLKYMGDFLADQDRVWNSVKRTLESFTVKSMTYSMHNAFESLQQDINSYMEDIEDAGDSMAGFIAIAGGRLMGIDLFGSPIIFKTAHKKVIRGYILEALSRRNEPTPAIKRDSLIKFWESIIRKKYEEYPAVAEGVEFRFRKNSLVARALVVDDKLVHMSVFPTDVFTIPSSQIG